MPRGLAAEAHPSLWAGGWCEPESPRGRSGNTARGTSTIRAFPSEVPRLTASETGHCWPDLSGSLRGAWGPRSKMRNKDPLQSGKQLLQVTPGGTLPHRRLRRSSRGGHPVGLLSLLNLPEGNCSGPVYRPLAIQDVLQYLQGLGDGTWLAFQGDCRGGLFLTTPQKAIDREGGLGLV